jgi:hypothetical protein
MKVQELNHVEMQNVNGGLLGLDGLLGGGGNSTDLLSNLANGLNTGIGYSSVESGNENTGEYYRSNNLSIGLGLLTNLLGSTR